MINKNLVLLSYGKESEYLRAIFCVLSFSSWCDRYLNTTRILIYTDKPEFFRSRLNHLTIEYITLTPDMLNQMLGGSDYIHRRKVGVIDLTFKSFPDQDLLFLDSDTFFNAESHGLFKDLTENESFMHKREYSFEEGYFLFSSFNQGEYPEAFINYITNRQFIIGDKSEVFSKNDYSWNSGVLGLNKTFATLIPDVYRLTDEFYENSRWFISEQLAFALILQRRTNIIPAEKMVIHYWGKRQKVLIDKLIAQCFDDISMDEMKNKFFIQSLTQKWKKAIELDIIMEQAVIALSNKYWKSGAFKVLQVLTKSPFDVKIYKEIFASLT